MADGLKEGTETQVLVGAFQMPVQVDPCLLCDLSSESRFNEASSSRFSQKALS